MRICAKTSPLIVFLDNGADLALFDAKNRLVPPRRQNKLVTCLLRHLDIRHLDIDKEAPQK